MTIAGTVAGDDLRCAVHPDDSTGPSTQVVGSIARPQARSSTRDRSSCGTCLAAHRYPDKFTMC